MLGSDAGRDPGRMSRESTSTGNTNNPSPMRGAALPSPASHPVPAPSPPQTIERARSLYQKSPSPERTNFSTVRATRPVRAFSGGASRRPFSGLSNDSSDIPKLGPASRVFSPRFSPTGDSSANNWRSSLDRRTSSDRLLERPNSQPSGYRTPPSELEKSVHPRPGTSEADGSRRYERSAKDFPGAIIADGATQNTFPVRDENLSNDFVNRTVQQSKEGPSIQSSSQDGLDSRPTNGPSYPFLHRPMIAPETQNPRIRPDVELQPKRVLEREHSASSQSPFSSESLRLLREERLQQQNSILSPPSLQSRDGEQINDRQGQPMSRNSSSTMLGMDKQGTDSASMIEGLDQPSRSGEEHLQHHRSSLALLVDNGRRGRVSPLPQAVQGAQGRTSGPASDPGIKNEFAKMFMGIGAGAGRAGRIGSGASSPFPSSPTKNSEPERRSPFIRRGDISEPTKSRAASRGGRRGRKTKDDEPKPEPESSENRNNAVTTSARGTKRTRHIHHHHPHQHPHQ